MSNRSLVDLRKLQRTQLKSINKDDIIDAILSAGDADIGPTSRLEERLSSIASELADLRQVITSSVTNTNKKLEDMQKELDKQADIITKQQLFLEQLDRKERETNVVVLGVPDEQEALDGIINDEEKLKKIWEEIGATNQIQSYKRLGRNEARGNRRRPILVTLASKSERDSILEKSPVLKERRTPYDKVYIKKDVHPAVRQEWKRLRDAAAAEKDRPENQGCNIRLDVKERKLYRDDTVIDKWNMHHF